MLKILQQRFIIDNRIKDIFLGFTILQLEESV